MSAISVSHLHDIQEMLFRICHAFTFRIESLPVLKDVKLKYLFFSTDPLFSTFSPPGEIETLFFFFFFQQALHAADPCLSSQYQTIKCTSYYASRNTEIFFVVSKNTFWLQKQGTRARFFVSPSYFFFVFFAFFFFFD